MVYNTSTMRRLIDAASNISAIGYRDTDDVETTLRASRGCALRRPNSDAPNAASSLCRQIYDQFLEERASYRRPAWATAPRYLTGYNDLDELLGGHAAFRHADTGCARPGLGKSALAVNVCD